MVIRSAEEMVKRVMLDPALMNEVKADPVVTLQKIAEQVVKDNPPGPPLQTDTWIYRLVVSALGLTVILSLISAVILTMAGKTPVPDVLTALGSAAVGALAGLLAPSPKY
jgi:hypothetical protein